MSSGQDRTEKATPKKRKKARRDGQIGNTPEVGAWVGMLAASFVLPQVAQSLLTASTNALLQIGVVIRNPEMGPAVAAAYGTFRAGLVAVLPMMGLILLIGVVSAVGQGGIAFAPKLLKPKFSRLNPMSGLKRMFGAHAAWQLIKALLKTSALGLVVYASVQHLIPVIIGSGSMPLSDLVDLCVSSVLSLIRYAAVTGLLMGLADYAVVRKRNNKHLKMTKQEIKDEFKGSEGDPHMKGARRSRAIALTRNRMLADVATADVVVVNPTHVAVALKYDPARGAPRVVAKGGDHMAAKIRELAEKHRVPMVSDVPLARTLFASCEVGQEIPADLYKAVATVLAFIMTLKRRGSAAGVHTVRTLVPSR